VHLRHARLTDQRACHETGSYWIYAVATVLATLAAGPLIDRITAMRVLPGFQLPLAVGLLVIWAFDDPIWVWPYLFFMGLTSGIGYTAITALWAEVYGLQHLGAIRSLAFAILVFATALGPAVMGGLMDGGITIETICFFFALYCLIASLLLGITLKSIARRSLSHTS